jgi:signal transduction histidine kinase
MTAIISGELTPMSSSPLPVSTVGFDILQRIYKASLKFMAPLDAHDTYATIVEEAIKLVGGSYGHIVLKHDGEFQKVYASNPISYKSRVQKRGYVHKVFITGRPLIIEADTASKKHPELKEMRIKSTIIIPLANRQDAMGALTLNSPKERHFGPTELNVLTLFGAMASMAIRKAQLYDEISKALELRDLFISMAAHELRTPLTTISGYAQLLKTKKDKLGPQEGRWVDELSWEITRMTYLVNELLEMNKIKSGKLQYNLKECSLNRIIGRALMDFRFSFPNRKIIFTSTVSDRADRVIGDFDKLLQAVINLLENAVKFSPIETPINVRLSYRSPYFKITIRDRGRGIPQEDMSKIFQGYYRGANNKVEGMGLGLYLVKDIVERHRGTVSVQSRLNKGTTVDIRLLKAKV